MALREYSVSQEQEFRQMIRYTKIFTRELAFAVDLMTYVMQSRNLKFRNFIFPNCFGRRGPSDFDDVMIKFVKDSMPETMDAKGWSILGWTVDLDTISYDDFKCIANGCAILQEQVEYDDYVYLNFCVMMAAMCCASYEQGVTMAPDFGIMIMCRTYTNFLIKAEALLNPWDGMKKFVREAEEE